MSRDDYSDAFLHEILSGLAAKRVQAFFKTLADVPGPIDMVDIFRFG